MQIQFLGGVYTMFHNEAQYTSNNAWNTPVPLVTLNQVMFLQLSVNGYSTDP